MDFRLSKEQKEYRQEIINFSCENLNDSNYFERFSLEMWKKVSDFGLLGMTIGEEYGGLGECYETAAIAFETLGYACKNNGFVFAINNHIWVSQNMIYLYGSNYLKDKYLHDMVSGKTIGTIGITEAESGSDALNMNTKAEFINGFYILNGNKIFISNGPIADIFVVFAITESEPTKKITAFVIQKDFDGVSIGENIEKMGLNACPMCELSFDNVKIPPNNILGKLNCGSNILTGALEWERCFEFAPYIGVMQRIMEESIKHTRARKQFGKPISEYQAISHRIAEMQVSIELSRLMLYKIAWLKDKGRSAFKEASIFKLFVSENYIKTCRDAMRIFGAYGYTKEYDLERELRDALASSIYSGTNEIQKNTIFNLIDF